MKKALFFLLCVQGFLFAQQVNFTHKLVYEINEPGLEKPLSIMFYAPENSNQVQGLVYMEDVYDKVVAIQWDKKLYGCEFLPNNGIQFNQNGIRGFSHHDQDLLQHFQLVEKTKKDTIINDIKATKFLLKLEGAETLLETYIAENHPINSAGFFNLKDQNGKEIKGLMVYLKPITETVPMILKSIEEQKFTLDMTNFAKQAEEWTANYQKEMEDYYGDGYETAVEAAAVAAIEATEAAEYDVAAGAVSAVEGVDYVDYASEYDYDYAQAVVDSAAAVYIPVYNDIKMRKLAEFDEENLAIANIDKDDEYWKAMPDLCKKYKKEIKLKDETYQNHLTNYVGQMCDLYLLNIDTYLIATFETTEIIKHEVGYLLENLNKLDAKDQQKVLKILKSFN